MGKTNMKANVLFTFTLLFTLLFSFVFTQTEEIFNTELKIRSVKPSGHCITYSELGFIQGSCDSNAKFYLVPSLRASGGGLLLKNCKSTLYYLIVSRNTGKAVYVEKRSKSNEAIIHPWSLHRADSQQWRFYKCSNSPLKYYIKNRRSGKCIDDRGVKELGGG